LIRTADADTVTGLDFLGSLQQRASGVDAPTNTLIEDARTAARNHDRASAILSLMRLRGHLAHLLEKWTSELLDLATEVSLFEPSLAGDASRI
jgi:hypothetical protein